MRGTGQTWHFMNFAARACDQSPKARVGRLFRFQVMANVQSKAKKKSGGLLGTIAGMLRDLRRDLTATYRPERHYMRGPGPKCHERRTPVSWNGAAN
jgi:hypothetical protein